LVRLGFKSSPSESRWPVTADRARLGPEVYYRDSDYRD
jgi:hypothetical protein